MQLELEAGHNAEIASATAYRPKEVWVQLGIHTPQVSICGDNVRSEKVINCKTILAHKVANAATQGESTNPNRSCITEACRQTINICCCCIFASRQSWL